MPRKKHEQSTNRGIDKDARIRNYNNMMLLLMEGKTLREVWKAVMEEIRDDGPIKRTEKEVFIQDYRKVAEDYIGMLQPRDKKQEHQLWDEETGEIILWKH